jgi:hypothetical protein
MRSVLINAFWPGLAVLMSWILDQFTGSPRGLPVAMVVATILLVTGSVIQILVVGVPR